MLQSSFVNRTSANDHLLVDYQRVGPLHVGKLLTIFDCSRHLGRGHRPLHNLCTVEPQFANPVSRRLIREVDHVVLYPSLKTRNLPNDRSMPFPTPLSQSPFMGEVGPSEPDEHEFHSGSPFEKALDKHGLTSVEPARGNTER